MSFPRYPAYKDSGVEWLGNVPEHWTTSKLGFETWVRARLGWKGLKADEYVDEGFAFLSTPNIKGAEIDFENVNFISQLRFDESPEIRLTQGDVLLAKDGSTLGIVNVIRRLPRPTTVNSSIAVITPQESLDSVFLFYLLAGSGMQQVIQQKKGGMGVPHLFQADLVKFQIPIPPKSEQYALAIFLDRETAKIDALIAEQQRLIELLQEKRQAVISHAVTKGLNPNAPMKDSGVEWAKKLPEHWTSKHLKRNVRLLTEKTETTECPVGLENLEGWTGRFIQTESDFQSEGVGFEADDILFGKLRPYLAKVWLADRNGEAIGDFHVLRPYERVNPRFIQYQLLTREVVDLVDGSSYGAKMPRASWGFLGCLEMPSPPAEEQLAIACFLDRETAKIDALIAEAPRAIKLLQGRRSALISAAVTGQIDVRGLVEAEAGEQ